MSARRGDGTAGISQAYLSIDQQRRLPLHRSLEGNDVATNLKWIMSSNSLC